MTIWKPNLSSSEGPLYKAIATAIATELREGGLQPGDQLPPQRELADQLQVTLGTVTRGYKEARRRGLVSGEVGRGTFVIGEPPRHAPLLNPGEVSDDLIELGMNLPLHSEDPPLGPVLESLAGEDDADLSTLLRYHPSRGAALHRATGAKWIERHGLPVEPEDVVICSGAQHAMAVLMLTLARPGGTVLVEELTYPGMKSLAALLRLRLEPVALDSEGLIPDALDEACRRTSAEVLYCMPTLHNPTTRTLSPGRRDELAEIARRHDLKVVEDDVHGHLPAEPVTPLASRLRERCFYIASISKALAGGLRVACVATPVGQRERIAAGVAATCWMTTPLSVEVATRWLEDGTAQRVIERKRREVASRQELAREILGGHRFETTTCSYHLWLQLPEPWRAEEFASEARARGVGVAPSGLFAVKQTDRPAAVRISLSAVADQRQLRRGLETIDDLLRVGPTPGPAVV